MISHSATVWAIFGVALICAEVVTTSFVLIFFGFAALIVAGLKFAGLDNLPLELTIFAVLGMLDIFLFRKKVMANFAVRHDLKTDASKHITLSHDVPPGGEAPVNYQGAVWTAVNETAQPLKKGEKVMIARTEGIKLIVAPTNHTPL